MKFKITHTLAACCLLIASSAQAQQDAHFSQYFSSPLNINPATAGLFDGDFRVVNNYRSQWGSVSSPYKTISIGIDGVLTNRTSSKEGFLGGGIVFNNDQTGDSEMNSTTVNIDIAYHKKINSFQYLSFGLQGGFLQRSIRYDNLYWDNQWNGLTFDTNTSSGESTRGTQISTLDFGAGTHWFAELSKYKRLFAGIGVMHLTKPDVSFMGIDDRLYRRLNIHGGAELSKDISNVMFIPNFLVSLQGPNTLINVGSDVKYVMRPRSQYTGLNDEISLGFGMYYRYGDAFFGLFRVGLGDFHLGVSYDLNLSGLSVATNGLGGYEVMLKYQTSFSKRRQTGVRFL